MPYAGTAATAPLTAPAPPYPSTDLPVLTTAAPVPLSATLAANEDIAARRRSGQAVLPLAFGEAGLPVHPALRAELSAAAGRGGGRLLGPPRAADQPGRHHLRAG